MRLSIGATIEKRFGPPLEAEVEVVRLVNSPRSAVGRIGERGSDPGGWADRVHGPTSI